MGKAPATRYATGTPSITADDRIAVEEALRSGWLGCGPQVAFFEAELSRVCKDGEAVAVSSGTAALTLTLAALGVNPGDEVVTSALTFAATANAITALGARPVLVDTLADGSSLDPEQVNEAAGPRLAAVVPVAWRGEPCDTATLRDLCAQISAITDRHVALIEDGAYALGSDHDDVLALSPATPVIISFHPTKIITAGLGGAVLGLATQAAETVRRMRNQGLDAPAFARLNGASYQASTRGFALEMSDIHAALGRSQLSRLEEVILRRRAVFEALRQHLTGLSIWCPGSSRVRFGTTNASLFAVLLEKAQSRDSIRRKLAADGVLTSVQYPFLADMPAWRNVRRISSLPHSRRLAGATLSLPSSPDLSYEDCRSIAQILRSALSAEDLM